MSKLFKLEDSEIHIVQVLSFLILLVTYVCIFLFPIIYRFGSIKITIPLYIITIISFCLIILLRFRKRWEQIFPYLNYQVFFLLLITEYLLINFSDQLSNHHFIFSSANPTTNQLFAIGVFFIITLGIYREKHMVFLMRVLAVLIILGSSLGIVTCFLWKNGYREIVYRLPWQQTLFYYHNGSRFDHNVLRLANLFGGPNLMGLYLVLIIPFLIFDIFYKTDVYPRTIKIMGLIIALYSLVLTYSREAWISGIVSAVIIGFIFFNKFKIRLHIKPIFVLGVLIVFCLLPMQFWTRMISISNFNDKSIMNRMIVWQSSLQMIGDYPLTGVGVDRFGMIYGQFYKPFALMDHYNDAHSTWLNLIVENGAIVFILYVFIIGAAIKTGFGLCRGNDEEPGLLLAYSLTTGLIGFCIFGFFDATFWDRKASVILWTFIGLLFFLERKSRENKSSLHGATLHPKHPVSINYLSCFVLITIILMGICKNIPLRKDVFKKRVSKITNGFSGDMGIAIKNLSTNETFFYNENKIFPTAELSGLLILPELYQQIENNKINQESNIIASKTVQGSGVLKYLDEGPSIKIRDLIRLMLLFNDSIAYKTLLQKVGVDPVNQKIQQLGLRNTSIREMDTNESNLQNGIIQNQQCGYTTPFDMLCFLEKLSNSQIISLSASEDIKENMTHSFYNEGIPRGISEGIVAHKTGNLDAARHDVGIITTSKGKYVIVILTNNIADKRWTADNEAVKTSAAIANITVNYFDGAINNQ